jgi:hypothetical protein
MIEGLLHRSAITIEEREELERELFDTSLTSERALEIIDYLNENKINTDLDREYDYSIDKDDYYN